MEGTVMLHILFAIKQDQDIGKELLEAVKVRTYAHLSVYVCMYVCMYVNVSLYSCHMSVCHCTCVTLCMLPFVCTVLYVPWMLCCMFVDIGVTCSIVVGSWYAI